MSDERKPELTMAHLTEAANWPEKPVALPDDGAVVESGSLPMGPSMLARVLRDYYGDYQHNAAMAMAERDAAFWADTMILPRPTVIDVDLEAGCEGFIAASVVRRCPFAAEFRDKYDDERITCMMGSPVLRAGEPNAAPADCPLRERPVLVRAKV